MTRRRRPAGEDRAKRGGGPPGAAPAPARSALPELLALALVVAATLVVYWPVRGFDFVNYDDNAFIFENARMQEGLTLRNVGWAFTVSVAANWHPLTVLTHLLDCSLYGLDAGGHHVTNLLLHLANVALLYLVLRRFALSAGASLLVAALFAVHPLNVESVAWVAERKNVLSMLFLFLTLWAYAEYARTGSRRAYALVLVAFAAGLMSKAMLVTVPFLLLLLDLWPLRRGSLDSLRTAVRDLLRLAPEKLPLLALALAASLLTILTQEHSEALGGLGGFPLAARLMNAAVSYLAYVGDLFWPADLAVFYPHRGLGTGVGPSLGAAAVLVGATALAWRQRLRRPYLLVGWLWYLGTLVPVIGLVQVGSQARADRYAYLPLLGLFLIAAALAEELAGRRRAAAAIAGALVVLALSVACRRQVLVWRDTETLFRHTVASVDGAYVAHNQLGILHATRGRYDEARREFETALAIQPSYYDGWNNLGQISLDQNDLEGAVRHYTKAIAYRRAPKALNNLGTALARLGRHAEAERHFAQALQRDPSYATARFNHAAVLAELGRGDEALRESRSTIAEMPGNPQAHNSLGAVSLRLGRLEEALAAYEAALRLDPGNAQARSGAAQVRQRLAGTDAAGR